MNAVVEGFRGREPSLRPPRGRSFDGRRRMKPTAVGDGSRRPLFRALGPARNAITGVWIARLGLVRLAVTIDPGLEQPVGMVDGLAAV